MSIIRKFGVLVAAGIILVGFAVPQLVGFVTRDQPVGVKIVACVQDRVDIQVTNPTGHHVLVDAWVDASVKGSPQTQTSTAEVTVVPHSQGTGFGRFDGSVQGQCTITQVKAYAYEGDGPPTLIDSQIG